MKLALGLFFSVALGAAPPAFDVASVRINPAVARNEGTIRYSAGTLTARGISLWLCVNWAYSVSSFQIEAPDWTQSAPLYDILAKTSSAVVESQAKLMLQTLLSDRFHLQLHREKKEMTVTALLVAKDGPKFQESTGKYDPSLGPEAPLEFLGYDPDVHMQVRRDPGNRVRQSFTNIPMDVFASAILMMGSRTPYEKVAFVDMTNLKGRYDLTVIHDPPAPAANPESGMQPMMLDIFFDVYRPLLRRNLGLTLERRKAMVDVLVIDQAEKIPSEN
jgi:uncharacterized protein (TIGR03435 family)